MTISHNAQGTELATFGCIFYDFQDMIILLCVSRFLHSSAKVSDALSKPKLQSEVKEHAYITYKLKIYILEIWIADGVIL